MTPDQVERLIRAVERVAESQQRQEELLVHLQGQRHREELEWQEVKRRRIMLAVERAHYYALLEQTGLDAMRKAAAARLD